jgi:hypothetical protein
VKLTYRRRQKLPPSAFAIPSERKYPIPDAAHARNALARVSQFGSPREKRMVCSAVRRRFPSIHAASCGMHHSRRHHSSHRRHRSARHGLLGDYSHMMRGGIFG